MPGRSKFCIEELRVILEENRLADCGEEQYFLRVDLNGFTICCELREEDRDASEVARGSCIARVEHLRGDEVLKGRIDESTDVRALDER